MCNLAIFGRKCFNLFSIPIVFDILLEIFVYMIFPIKMFIYCDAKKLKFMDSNKEM